MLGSFDTVEEDARFLFEYADRLDALRGSDWPQAMLPPTA